MLSKPKKGSSFTASFHTKAMPKAIPNRAMSTISSTVRVPDLSRPSEVHLEANLSCLPGYDRLSEQQRLALYLMAYGHLNVFFTGSSGTGKSWVLKAFHRLCQELDWQVQFSSTTGISATLLPNAMTLHSFLKIGLAQGDMDKIVDQAASNQSVQARFESLQCLVIDEVSMMSARLLHLLDRICREVRSRPGVPYGGLQVILVGDFAQLSPVNRDIQGFQQSMGQSNGMAKGPNTTYSALSALDQADATAQQKAATSRGLTSLDFLEYCFEHPEWANLVDVTWSLEHVYRQSSNDFAALLNRMRFGKIDGQDALRLMEKCKHGDALLHQVEVAERQAERMAERQAERQAELQKDSSSPKRLKAASSTISPKEEQTDQTSSSTKEQEVKEQKLEEQKRIDAKRQAELFLPRSYCTQSVAIMNLLEDTAHVVSDMSNHAAKAGVVDMFSFYSLVGPILPTAGMAHSSCVAMCWTWCAITREPNLDHYVFMYGTNKRVDTKNDMEMGKLKQRLLRAGFQPKNVLRKYTFSSSTNRVNQYNRDLFQSWLADQKRNCLAKPELELALGAKVMLLVNLDFERQLVNGSTGIIVGFQKQTHFPIVRFLSTDVGKRQLGRAVEKVLKQEQRKTKRHEKEQAKLLAMASEMKAIAESHARPQEEEQGQVTLRR